MKIVFLDVDGVLNCDKRWRGPKGPDLDGICLSLLVKIVTETDAKIVISSTWRKYPDWKQDLMLRLKEFGIDDRVIGQTPIYKKAYKPRGSEIKLWLSQHPGVQKYAVIDDDADAGMSGVGTNFFQTTEELGLTEEIADKVIAHLSD